MLSAVKLVSELFMYFSEPNTGISVVMVIYSTTQEVKCLVFLSNISQQNCALHTIFKCRLPDLKISPAFCVLCPRHMLYFGQYIYFVLD